ncbi:MAG: hypothetical protein ACOYLE_11075 [Bacteroidales bacterium]
MKDIYRKLNFYFDRRRIYIILWFLSFVSTILVIKTTNEPVIGFIKGTFIEKYLHQFSCANTVINDLSIGFLVSVIFYLIVVYSPDKQKQNDIEPFISTKCESLILSSNRLINEIIKKSNTDCDIKTITKLEFHEICKKVNPKIVKYKFAHNLNERFEGNMGYKIYHDWEKLIVDMDELLRLLPYIDSGLLKRIYKIYNNPLRFVSKDLAHIDKFVTDSLEPWFDTFYSFHLASKDLRDYYVLYFKKDIANDPWK